MAVTVAIANPSIPELLSYCRTIAAQQQEALHRAATYGSVEDLPFDIEDFMPSAERTPELLAFLRGQKIHVDDPNRRRFTPRSAVQGLPPIAADKICHRQIAGAIRARFPKVMVIGEEASEADWEEAMNADPGTVIVDVDPIDGSLPFDTLGCGYSTNFVIYRRALGTYHGVATLAHLVVSSSGRDLLFVSPNAVTVGHRGDHLVPRSDFQCTPEDVRPGTVAVVGTQGKHRRGGPSVLFDTELSWGLPPYESGGRTYYDPPLTCVGLGGAPFFVEMILMRLETIVIPHAQTVHDAAGLPALLALGAHCFDFDGNPITMESLMAAFTVLGPPNSEIYTPIPGMVISRNESLGRLIAERVGHADSVGMRLRAVEDSDQKPPFYIVEDDKDDENDEKGETA